MIWPPLKAWTSKEIIDDHLHFVAINYGGKLTERWVVLMSVLDAGVVVKVFWSELVDQSKWVCGWDDNKYSNTYKLVNDKCETSIDRSNYLSIDSGLTIPITKMIIRPWFDDS